MQSVKKELRSLVSYKKFLVILIPVVVLLSIPQITHAETPGVILRFFETVIGNSIYEALGKLLVGIGNFVLTIASLYLRICGTLFNGAMSLTLNMSEFVNNNPAINIVWRVIRDFTGIFFIFLLIWNSIKMILGKNDSGVKSLILNIVVCGLLINFSLFFTKAIVDASNILSLSIYRAIAPGEVISVTDTSATGKISEWGKQVFNDNGIANVFMSALKIPSIYDPNYIAKDKAQKLENSGAISVYFKTAIATFMGAAIMVIAGTNFAIAAVLFLGRFAALILLMAFSPIAFLGDVFPDLKKKKKKWWSTLSGQATFAPVYLLLIYVAMKIVTDERFKAALGSNDPNVTFSAALSGNGPMGVFMQYGIVIYFITTALIVAKDMSGEVGKMSTKYGGLASGFLLQNTLGRGSKMVLKSEAFQKLATNAPSLGVFAKKGLTTLTKAEYGGSKGGYDKRFKDYSKDLSDLGKDIKANPNVIKAKLNDKMDEWREKSINIDKIHADEKTKINKEIMDLVTKNAELEGKKRDSLSGIEKDELEAKIQKNKSTIESKKTERTKLEEKQKKEKDSFAAPDAEKKYEKAQKENIEKEEEKKRKETYIKNIEPRKTIISGVGRALTGNFLTAKAREDAASEVRKSMGKSKKDKAWKDILDLAKESEDKPEKDEKPDGKGEKGGDKPPKADDGH